MDARVCALRSWTIKKRGEEFFIATMPQSGRHRWRGLYTNPQRATTAIVRKVQSDSVRLYNRVVQQ
jgi:hypothetical protein